MANPTALEQIRARDAAAGALWFTGPESFTALAARDRRSLLAEIDRLNARIAQMRAAFEHHRVSSGRWDRVQIVMPLKDFKRAQYGATP